MKNTLKIMVIAGLGFSLALLSACHKKQEKPLPAALQTVSYTFNPASPLVARMGDMPPVLMQFLNEMDSSSYEQYKPSAAEKDLVMEYLKLLPPVYERVFHQRCLGIYFIKNFKGNGLTSWAVDPSGKIYFSIVLNPAGFKQDVSTTLTQRERSCFISTPAPDDVRVSIGRRYKGLIYGVFHEATHGVDIVAGITPYADDTLPGKYWPKRSLGGDLFTGIWKDYYIPRSGMDYKLRDRITFYGLGGGPKLSYEDAADLYAGLMGSRFISLYGSRSWAEDLAELVTFYMLTQKMGQPYTITLEHRFAKSMFEPMKNPRVQYRAQTAMRLIENL